MWLRRPKRPTSRRTPAAPAFRPAVEGLEVRAVPAFVGPRLLPPGTGNAGGGSGSNPVPVLVGEVDGTWTVAPPNGHGTTEVLSGHGTVTPLGALKVSGSFTVTNFTANGTLTGTITLTSTGPGAGSNVTLRLQGHAPVPNGAPSALTYTIVTGKGTTGGVLGSGTAHLRETFNKGSIFPTFALTFG